MNNNRKEAQQQQDDDEEEAMDGIQWDDGSVRTKPYSMYIYVIYTPLG